MKSLNKQLLTHIQIEKKNTAIHFEKHYSFLLQASELTWEVREGLPEEKMLELRSENEGN